MLAKISPKGAIKKNYRERLGPPSAYQSIKI